MNATSSVRVPALRSSGEPEILTSAALEQNATILTEILAGHEAEILADWISNMGAAVRRRDLLKEADLQAECARLLSLMKKALESAGKDFQSHAWNEVRNMLSSISQVRSHQGFTPSETALFVFSMKQPLMKQIREFCKSDAETFATEIWTATELLDAMGLYTAESYQKSREGIVKRQQEELLELSTPVVKLWDGVLALPVVGTLDSARTQILMESLLEAIVSTNSRIAIIDISGVPTVDTVVAQHLLKTITAARLMGAECIISGVRPQIAQTIVHLGIDLKNVPTKATLEGALQVAIRFLGLRIERSR